MKKLEIVARSMGALLVLISGVGSSACGGPPARNVPPPEYERPEVPPWQPASEDPTEGAPAQELPPTDQPEQEPPRDPDAPATEPPPAPPELQDPTPTVT